MHACVPPKVYAFTRFYIYTGIHERTGIARQTDRQTESQSISQSGRQTDRQTDRQRQADRQAYTHTHTHTHTNIPVTLKPVFLHFAFAVQLQPTFP